MGLNNCVYNYIMINPVNFKLINANTGYIAAAVLQNAHIRIYILHGRWFTRYKLLSTKQYTHWHFAWNEFLDESITSIIKMLDTFFCTIFVIYCMHHDDLYRTKRFCHGCYPSVDWQIVCKPKYIQILFPSSCCTYSWIGVTFWNTSYFVYTF